MGEKAVQPPPDPRAVIAPHVGAAGAFRRPHRPPSGAVLGHGQTGIAFGVSGQTPGRDYMAAGLKIVYRSAGVLHTVTAWSGIAACVRTHTGQDCAASNRVADLVGHMAGLS
jgi:hypothetical protein